MGVPLWRHRAPLTGPECPTWVTDKRRRNRKSADPCRSQTCRLWCLCLCVPRTARLPRDIFRIRAITTGGCASSAGLIVRQDCQRKSAPGEAAVAAAEISASEAIANAIAANLKRRSHCRCLFRSSAFLPTIPPRRRHSRRYGSRH